MANNGTDLARQIRVLAELMQNGDDKGSYSDHIHCIMKLTSLKHVMHNDIYYRAIATFAFEANFKLKAINRMPLSWIFDVEMNVENLQRVEQENDIFVNKIIDIFVAMAEFLDTICCNKEESPDVGSSSTQNAPHIMEMDICSGGVQIMTDSEDIVTGITRFRLFLRNVKDYMKKQPYHGSVLACNHRFIFADVTMEHTQAWISGDNVMEGLMHFVHLRHFILGRTEPTQEERHIDQWCFDLLRFPPSVMGIQEDELSVSWKTNVYTTRVNNFDAFLMCYNRTVSETSDQQRLFWPGRCNIDTHYRQCMQTVKTEANVSFLKLQNMLLAIADDTEEDLRGCISTFVRRFVHNLDHFPVVTARNRTGGSNDIDAGDVVTKVISLWLKTSITWPFYHNDKANIMIGCLPYPDASILYAAFEESDCSKSRHFRHAHKYPFLKCDNLILGNMLIPDNRLHHQIKISSGYAIFGCGNTFLTKTDVSQHIPLSYIVLKPADCNREMIPFIRFSAEELHFGWVLTMYLDGKYFEKTGLCCLRKLIAQSNSIFLQQQNRSTGAGCVSSWTILHYTSGLRKKEIIVQQYFRTHTRPQFYSGDVIFPANALSLLVDALSALAREDFDTLLQFPAALLVDSFYFDQGINAFVFNIVQAYMKNYGDGHMTVEEMCRKLLDIDTETPLASLTVATFLAGHIFAENIMWQWVHTKAVLGYKCEESENRLERSCAFDCMRTLKLFFNKAIESDNDIQKEGLSLSTLLLQPADAQFVWLFLDPAIQRWMNALQFDVNDTHHVFSELACMCKPPTYISCSSIPERAKRMRKFFKLCFDNMRESMTIELMWNVKIFGKRGDNNIDPKKVKKMTKRVLDNSNLLCLSVRYADTINIKPGILWGNLLHLMQFEEDGVEVDLDSYGKAVDISVLKRLQCAVNASDMETKGGVWLFFVTLLLQINCYMRDTESCIPRMHNIPISFVYMIMQVIGVSYYDTSTISKAQKKCELWSSMNSLEVKAADILAIGKCDSWEDFWVQYYSVARYPSKITTRLVHRIVRQCEAYLKKSLSDILELLGPMTFYRMFINNGALFVSVADQRLRLLHGAEDSDTEFMIVDYGIEYNCLRILKDWIRVHASDEDVVSFIYFATGMEFKDMSLSDTKIHVSFYKKHKGIMQLPLASACVCHITVPNIDIIYSDKEAATKAAAWIGWDRKPDDLDQLAALFFADRMSCGMREGMFISEN